MAENSPATDHPETEKQDARQMPHDNAENRMDAQTASRWSAEKHDVKGHEELHANAAANGETPADENTGRGVHGTEPIESQPPEAFTGLHVGKVKDRAAGMPAVLNSARHLFKEIGVVQGSRVMLKVNQKGGIDCSSCAWPEPDGDRSMFEFCESGAKAIADEATKKRATPDFFRQHSVAELSTQSDYWLGQQGRITHPMILKDGATHYEPIEWDDAFKLLATELNALKSPDEAVFYTSGRTSNEAAFLYQLFARQFGTNNMPDCSNMCHESSGSALTPTIGIGKGTVKLDDFEKAQVIVLIGQNPGTNHPRMLTTLQKAKRAGAKIIAVNPLPEAGLMGFMNPQEAGGMIGLSTTLADMFLQVRVNGDVALFKGILKEILAAGAVDTDFIQKYTTGYEEFAADIRSSDWNEIVEDSGISREQIREAAALLGKSGRIICCWAMGLTQSPNSVDQIQEIINLLLVRGSIGKDGAGACPVRGHSNVQGDRTMGIWERPREEFLNQLASEFRFEPPRHHGYDVVESIKAMHAGKVKIFFAMGGNFLSATPDTEYTAMALRNQRLTAQVSTKLNRSHLVVGRTALILPCFGRTDIDQQKSGPQFVSTENSMGVVETSQGILKPPSQHLMSEPSIVAHLAKATLGSRTTVDWESLGNNYDLIRDLIARAIPGCERYNERVRAPGGFYLPNLPRQGDFDHTPSHKANFTVHEIPKRNLLPGQLVMMTIRSHDQFNTTVYGLHDRYRGVNNERRVVLMNDQDMQSLNLKPRDVVDVTSHFNGKQRIAKHFTVLPYNIPRRCCAMYFPEANVLVPIDSVAEKSNTPTSKYVIVTVASAGSTARFDYDKIEAAQGSTGTPPMSSR
jgi:molybdopterin-dependent oxidoreductase alpha subunit